MDHATAPATMPTEDLIAEINRSGPEVDMAAQRMSPDEWVAAGNLRADYPLSSGKRLGDATREDLMAEKRVAADLMARHDRLADLYTELAKRHGTLTPHQASLPLYLAVGEGGAPHRNPMRH